MSKYDKLDETFDVTPTEVEVTEKKIEKIKSVISIRGYQERLRIHEG